jgi:hypothetical protein
MTSDELSKLLGEYFRHVVTRHMEDSAHAAVHGVGKPVRHPITGESLARKATGAIASLAEQIKARKLDTDPVFVKALTAAIAEITEAPVAYVLEELRTFEENGDGGPDPSFELNLHGSDAANMELVLKGFRAKGSNSRARR